MKQLAEFALEDGTSFFIEVDETQTSAIEQVALPSGELIVKAKMTFEDALERIKPVAATVISKMKSLKTPADEVEVKFGLKLNTAVGAVVTSVGGEASYEVTLKWKQVQGN